MCDRSNIMLVVVTNMSRRLHQSTAVEGVIELILHTLPLPNNVHSDRPDHCYSTGGMRTTGGTQSYLGIIIFS